MWNPASHAHAFCVVVWSFRPIKGLFSFSRPIIWMYHNCTPILVKYLNTYPSLLFSLCHSGTLKMRISDFFRQIFNLRKFSQVTFTDAITLWKPLTQITTQHLQDHLIPPAAISKWPCFYSDGMKDDIRLALARWGLKDRCRRITTSVVVISHNQCQYWWTSMRVGWRLTLHHGRKKESQSQYSQAASTTKRYHTSKQVGFEPDPLDSFVIENTRDITTNGWSPLR